MTYKTYKNFTIKPSPIFFAEDYLEFDEDEAQAEALSALPQLCPDCNDLAQDCECQPITPIANSIIFAETGVTLVVDGRPLRASLSYRSAVEWRQLLWSHCPQAEIEIDWAK